MNKKFITTSILAIAFLTSTVPVFAVTYTPTNTTSSGVGTTVDVNNPNPATNSALKVTSVKSKKKTTVIKKKITKKIVKKIIKKPVKKTTKTTTSRTKTTATP